MTDSRSLIPHGEIGAGIEDTAERPNGKTDMPRSAGCLAHLGPNGQGQTLTEHLENVGECAASFGRSFGGSEWARLAGLWHDLGKYSIAFQRYLARAASSDSHQAETSGKVDHSTAGAQHAVNSDSLLGHLLAYVVAGHHAGLLDGRADGACLESRLGKKVESWGDAPSAVVMRPTIQVPSFVQSSIGCRDAFSIAFFVRTLFSCLVDADFLDTERFLDPARAAQRPQWPSDILGTMASALAAYLRDLEVHALDTDVNRERAQVLRSCLEAASQTPGLFSLTVPTGGGKTLSSLAFAIDHARAHALSRVIYVIPFTSIIEQNAAVFRTVFDRLRPADLPDPVLEHHSALDVGEETTESRLAAENWDAPLVVTTAVQFYESLFASGTSRCRKLHNLARSVIVLDEAQTLPVDLLHPCLRSLQELAVNYGASVVLCTATQPAIGRREDFTIGLEGVREIIPEPRRLYLNLRRVTVKDLGKLDDEALSARLGKHEAVLCIANTRSHARKLFEALGDQPEHFHLSAQMCPEHRTAVLARIRGDLDAGRECRVISTQLIEAGVDIDFPVVYRALAGIDAIAQAAGRCNRNGLLGHLGRTFVFRSEHTASERYFRDTASIAEQVLALHEDPLSLEAVESYFKLYYWDQSSRWDAKKILDEFHLVQDRRLPFQFGFATAAQRFHLIEETGKPVIVPWGSRGRKLGEELLQSRDPPPRTLLRSLQRYTVTIPFRAWHEHVGRSIVLVHERYPVLISPEAQYSERLGLVLGGGHMPYLEA